ncbi:uncharacterized protein BKA55DRAFT_523738 [Fusarium redolens]|uniref:Uncharacterized protein n=1 Tax=Fusarium redolens TaxID=48865 RepID=A0A9P9JP77_FUSRE|nr:uncharacterized protein BKA55DRAFT_523738 [Fusarium redolens]KAH7232392.1 hypothetical protein BKA55DRAFT_523738 [Fusarium redolens]
MKPNWFSLLAAIPTAFSAPLAEAASEAVTKSHGQRCNSTNPTASAYDKTELEFRNTFHLSTAICGSVLLLFWQYYVRHSGYTLSRRWWHSTDDVMWILMGLISISWTVIIPVSALYWDHCASIDGVFIWWAIRRIIQMFSVGKLCRRSYWEAVIVFILTVFPAVRAAVGALEAKLYVLGMLTFACIAMFFLILPVSYRVSNYDTHLAHRMAYVLPYHSFYHSSGFSPVISYSIDSEQQLLKSNKQFLEPMDTKDWKIQHCRAAAHTIVTSLIENIDDDRKMIQRLGSWLYLHPNVHERWPALPTRNGILRPGYFLIGRDVVFALLLWERLVFERRWQLDKEFRDRVWLLHERKYTGRGLNDSPNRNIPATRGKPKKGDGLDGLLEAFDEVYRILDHTSPQRLNPPSSSVVDDLVPVTSVEVYAVKLWEACWKEYPSTFGALYLWTTVWYIDMGNIGFHTTPLLPNSKAERDTKLWLDYAPDYMTAWRIRWRYLWHSSILCQLVIMLPTIIKGLVVGIM